jgi:hypothetical protein
MKGGRYALLILGIILFSNLVFAGVGPGSSCRIKGTILDVEQKEAWVDDCTEVEGGVGENLCSSGGQLSMPEGYVLSVEVIEMVQTVSFGGEACEGLVESGIKSIYVPSNKMPNNFSFRVGQVVEGNVLITYDGHFDSLRVSDGDVTIESVGGLMDDVKVYYNIFWKYVLGGVVVLIILIVLSFVLIRKRNAPLENDMPDVPPVDE